MGTFDDKPYGFDYCDGPNSWAQVATDGKGGIHIEQWYTEPGVGDRFVDTHYKKPDIPELISRLAKLAGVRVENIEYDEGYLDDQEG